MAHAPQVADGTLGPRAVALSYAWGTVGLVALGAVEHPTVAADLFLIGVAPGLLTLGFQVVTGGRPVDAPRRGACVRCEREGRFVWASPVSLADAPHETGRAAGPACPRCAHRAALEATRASLRAAWRTPWGALTLPGVALHNALMALRAALGAR